MANQTIYPFGTGGSLPSNIGIVNDYHTGGADKALSAEVGKQIGEAVFGDEAGWRQLDLSSLSVITGGIGEGKFYEESGTSVLLPVTPGETYRIVGSSNDGSAFTFLARNILVQNTAPNFAIGYSDRVLINTGEEAVVTVPTDAVSMWIRKTWRSGGGCLPEVYIDSSGGSCLVVRVDKLVANNNFGIEVDKNIIWSPGYVKGSTGVVTASTTASFSQPVLLKAGEKLSYKTTDVFGKAVVKVADDTAVAVGDTLSGDVLINYQSANTTVEYTATEDTYIVISIMNPTTSDKPVIKVYAPKEGNFTDMVKNTFNSSFNAEDTEAARNEFCGMLKGTDKVETFLFFSDPHLTDYSRYEEMTELVRDKYISSLQKHYNSLPLDFCICGGDWLNSEHTDAGAVAWLGYSDAYMRKLFRNYYPVFGNHDNNPYKIGINQQSWPYALDYDTVRNAAFRENKSTYYSFDGLNTKFYVINSGVSFIKGMTDNTYSYLLMDRWAQVDWFGQKLLADDPENAIVISHIYSNANKESEWNSSATGYWAVGPHALSRNIRDLAIAYNKRQSITKNGITYDFSGCTGRVVLYLCGHTHFDFVDAFDELPVVCITNLEGGHFVGESVMYDLIPTFDCSLVDYDNDKYKTLRVGAGVSRIVNFTPIPVSVGNTYALTSELSGTLTWATQNSAKATVNSGVVTAVASGCAGIIATDENGKQEYWIIKVS